MENIKKHQHFKLFKPYGVLSQFSSRAKQEQKKHFLGELFSFPENTMPIGRLDEDSEGLLLLTTDGKLSNHINSSSIEKEYYVLVDGEITDEALLLLEQGVTIGNTKDAYRTKPCKVSLLQEKPILPERKKKIRDDRHGPTSWVSITLREGKFRQVRKMTATVGFPTLRLVRFRVGTINIENLAVSEVESLTIDDIKNLDYKLL